MMAIKRMGWMLYVQSVARIRAASRPDAKTSSSSNTHAKTARWLRPSFIDAACVLLITRMNAFVSAKGQSLFCQRLA